MTALSRFAAAFAVALTVASCGQKGPLVLPEERATSADAAPMAVRLAQGEPACGSFPRV
ncbi:MAG: lipoprotein [Pseudomonadales bacterium]|jgi:predicted small lipoprotein YifL|nr:lipoprotein [Pseudomonadales bacterium]